MKQTYKGLTIRGDSLYCPLPFGLDTYYNCEFDCAYCFCRGLNEIWGKEFRGLDLEWFERILVNGLKNPSPKTSLSNAIKSRKTLRFGNKSDPFQPIERQYKLSLQVLQILKGLNWDVKIETRGTDVLIDYFDLLVEMKAIITVSITVGLENDRKLFEGERTPLVIQRLEFLKLAIQNGLQVGVITEPFISGFHEIKDWENFLNILQEYGIKRVNFYNLHFTPFVAKRLHKIGVDIERVWKFNQDEEWRKIVIELLRIGKEKKFIMGCPDFVNSGNFSHKSNTCCGVDVKNPCSFNIVGWKEIGLKKGKINLEDVLGTWDGVGDRDDGIKIFKGEEKRKYNLNDIKKNERGFGL